MQIKLYSFDKNKQRVGELQSPNDLSEEAIIQTCNDMKHLVQTFDVERASRVSFVIGCITND